MIQEVLRLGGEDTKISTNGGGLLPSLSSSTATTSSNSQNQNLRCPRCDSSNTKFCYYNNYNLSQPRHFCKTCRRYWTKGGALRNVPIGGGCRKNKNVTVSKGSAGRTKAVGRSGFDHVLPQSPILWGSPQNTHLLALLRTTQNPNPNYMSVAVKEEGNSHSHVVSDCETIAGLLNPRTLGRGYDGVGQVPSMGLGFCRRHNLNQPQQQNSGFVFGEHPNAGFQELYDKLIRSSPPNYCNINMFSSASLSNILESSTELESNPFLL